MRAVISSSSEHICCRDDHESASEHDFEGMLPAEDSGLLSDEMSIWEAEDGEVETGAEELYKSEESSSAVLISSTLVASMAVVASGWLGGSVGRAGISLEVDLDDENLFSTNAVISNVGRGRAVTE